VPSTGLDDEVEERRSEGAPVNERGAPIALGAAALCTGIVAAVTSGALSTTLAVVAGVLGLAAGAVALLVWSVEDRRRDAHAAALDSEHRTAVEQALLQLAQAEARIHELEAAAAVEPPQSDVQDAADPSSLTDPDSKLFSEAYFRVALDARIASARRHLRPVAIALLDVFEGAAGSSGPPALPERAAESIRETVRDADTACRLGDGVYAIILEDTPENGAVWTVERVRRNLVSRHGSHTMWAGVACYPAHAFSTEELLDQARGALESAREWKQDRIEVAISE
jgi:diguanylate cyclase (GGDEF)-like protein